MSEAAKLETESGVSVTAGGKGIVYKSDNWQTDMR
jgi:hypothetical protein